MVIKKFVGSVSGVSARVDVLLKEPDQPWSSILGSTSLTSRPAAHGGANGPLERSGEQKASHHS